MSENVKVCVRVRPFNKREKERGAKLIIGMEGKTTTISNPNDKAAKPKSFAFDGSYWSHDGFNEEEDGSLVATGNKYATQQGVFDDLGTGILQNAYEGYNTSLFAYGQTGSGKSYSMVGYGPNKGIVPIAFNTMFEKINSNKEDNINYQVTFSMIEIYMEQVSDLLNDSKKKLKVRQNPKEGRFFVDGVMKTPVSSYEEIDGRMNDAMKRRTVAATQMNATSSRAHTVVTLVFSTNITDKDTGKKTTRSSEINLVDLAGSERANSTGATGDRLKEGAQINLSLSALGNVISALAAGKKAPFRDSVLTKLLQNSLGGNARTIMMAALSPADINFDETLSTLRYADRAKQIKNKAVVNESATDKLIRNLKEENEKMKAMLEGKMPVSGTAGMSETEVAKMRKEMEANIRAQLVANDAAAAGLDNEGYSKKAAEIKAKYEAKAAEEAELEHKNAKSHKLVNINEDPGLSGMVVHFLDEGETLLGRKAKSNVFKPKIQLAGLSINDKHCTLILKGGKLVLSIPEEITESESKTAVNGKPVDKLTELQHGDRLLFGTNHLYQYVDPKPSKARLKELPESIDWEFAQGEIMTNKGFAMEAGEDSLHLSAKTREEVMELLPMVTVANAISERLDKKRAYEIAVLSGPVAGLQRNESKVMIKMRNLDTNNKWMIDHSDFIQRHFLMQKMLQKFGGDDDDESDDEDEDDDDDDDDGEDPFDVKDSHIILGTATCFLQSLCYRIEFDDTLNIVDYKGRSEGKLALSVFPCEADGTLLDTNDVNEDPKDLLGKPLSFKVSITGASVKKPKYAHGVLVKFEHEFLGGEIETPNQTGTNPVWNFEKVFTIQSVTEAGLDWLSGGNIGFFVYVWQSDSDLPDLPVIKGNSRLSTAEVMKERRASGITGIINTGHEAGALTEAIAKQSALQNELNELRAASTKQASSIARINATLSDGGMSAEEKMETIKAMLEGTDAGLPATVGKTKGSVKKAAGAQSSGMCAVM